MELASSTMTNQIYFNVIILGGKYCALKVGMGKVPFRGGVHVEWVGGTE